MNELPRPAQIYIWLVSGLGLTAAISSLLVLPVEFTTLLVILTLAITIAVLDHYPVRLYSNQANGVVEITISIAVKIAAVLLLPPPVVVLSVFCGTLLAEVWLRRVWYKLIFNVGMVAAEFAVVSVLYSYLRDPSVPLLGSPQNIFALVALGISDVVLNGIFVCMVIALATKSPIRYIWEQNYRPLVLYDLSMVPIGVFIYILWIYSPWSIVLAAVPLLVMRHSYKLVNELRRQTRQALYALAQVLDERDQQTTHHSELVAEHAALIARTLELDAEQVEVITLAAVMHDIGKIGMRNDILFKPGSLSHEEREMAKRHAAIGGNLLEKFPLFEKGASYVRHHHERWDGGGYPDGLRGEAIPLGARILAVADSFQAMIEKRPYREPIPEPLALQRLWESAGSQFDPDVVTAFLRAKGVGALLPATSSTASQDVVRIGNQS